jgi:hypothetical protein
VSRALARVENGTYGEGHSSAELREEIYEGGHLPSRSLDDVGSERVRFRQTKSMVVALHCVRHLEIALGCYSQAARSHGVAGQPCVEDLEAVDREMVRHKHTLREETVRQDQAEPHHLDKEYLVQSVDMRRGDLKAALGSSCVTVELLTIPGIARAGGEENCLRHSRPTVASSLLRSVQFPPS